MAVAPSYTTALVGGAPWHVPGNLKEAVYTLTVGASDTYATGGFAIAASSFGLQRIEFIFPITFSTGHWGIYDSSAGKIKVFSAAGTELANTSGALQSATALIVVIGK